MIDLIYCDTSEYTVLETSKASFDDKSFELTCPRQLKHTLFNISYEPGVKTIEHHRL